MCVAKGEIELNTVRRRDYFFDDVEQEGKIIPYRVEKKGEHLADITIRCRRCNQLLLCYDLTHDDDRMILDNVMLPPCRCTRVIRFKKYTEGILRRQAVDNVVRI